MRYFSRQNSSFASSIKSAIQRIVRDISFYNKAFLKEHADIVVEKKTDSPDEDKSLADSKALIPVLKDFFQKHPLIKPKFFLGDAAFDSVQIYRDLFHELHFAKVFIPLRNKLSLPQVDYPIDENGVPCCPKDPSLVMKCEGSKSHLRCELPTMKFVCPKMKWVFNKSTKKSKRICFCDDPCTTSYCGRMIYVYQEQNIRAYHSSISLLSNMMKILYHMDSCISRANHYAVWLFMN